MSQENAQHAAAAPLRLLLADDDKIVLEALSTSFGRHPDIDLVAAVTSGAEALDTLFRQPADVALLDVEMPGMDGIETAKRVHESYPDVVIVIYTNFEHEGSFERAMAAGARGFLTKDMPFDALADGVKRAFEGVPVMGSRPIEILLDYFNQHPGKEELDLRQAVSELPDHLRRVLDQLVLGKRNKTIATNLCLSESTVRTYVSELLNRTGCSARSELASRVARTGYSPQS